MGSYTAYHIPLVRSAEGAMPVEATKQGGRYILVVTGDFAGATIDLRVKYAAHPVDVEVLGIQVPDPLMNPPITLEKNVTELYLPVGTEVSTAIMGGTPTSVNISLILVE